MIYFDNHPHGHYGTIRQQIWSALHLPAHLAIVGIVEGAQQVALARYVLGSLTKLEKNFVQFCFEDHFDGQQLVTKLRDAVLYFKLDKKLEGLIFLDDIETELYRIGNTTGICSLEVAGTSAEDFPDDISLLFADTASAIYMSLGIKIPLNKNILEVALESWKLVYIYFWCALLLLLVCFMAFMFLIRKSRRDLFDWVSQIDRMIAFVITLVFLGLAANKQRMYGLLQTPIILPVGVSLLYMIIIVDRLAAWIANRRNRASGEPLTGDGQVEHPDGHGTDGKDPNAISLQPLGVSHGASYNPLGSSIMPQYHATDNGAYTSSSSTPIPFAPVPEYQPHPQSSSHVPSPGHHPTTQAYTTGGYVRIGDENIGRGN
jgi:hypothetical protein